MIPHTVTGRKDLRGGEQGGDRDGEEERDNKEGGGRMCRRRKLRGRIGRRIEREEEEGGRGKLLFDKKIATTVWLSRK